MFCGSAAKTILDIHRMNVADFGALWVFGHALFGGESFLPSPATCSRCVDQYEPVSCLEDPDFSRFAERRLNYPSRAVSGVWPHIQVWLALTIEHVQDPLFEGHPALLVIESPWEAPSGLSIRQLDVLNGLAQGASNRRIASERSISVRTVTTHVERILVKLGQESPAGAAAKATREGFLRLDLMATLPVSPGPRFFGTQA